MVRKTGVTACLVGVLVLIAAACTPAPATAPVAKLQANLTSGEAPFSVSFTSTGSTVPEDTTWLWEFGAGEGTSTNVGSTSHVYSNVGSFTAKLTLTAPGGTSTSESVTITVNEPPPDTTFFVRAVDGVDNTNCGPKTAPCQTIDHGQSRAAATPGITRVRVAGGSYGAFTVRSGLTLEGGWNQTFTARGPADISTVSGAYDGSTNWAIRANNITAPTTVFGFTVQGATAGAGQTTAGVLVNGAVNGLLLDSLVVNGGVGVDATGLLVDGAGVSATIKNSDVNSGTPVGAGNSAYGVRALNGSVLSVVDSTITAQAGIAGASSTDPAPAKTANGTNGNNGNDGPGGCAGNAQGGAAVGSGVRLGGKGGNAGGGCAGDGQKGDNGGGGAVGGNGGNGNGIGIAAASTAALGGLAGIRAVIEGGGTAADAIAAALVTEGAEVVASGDGAQVATTAADLLVCGSKLGLIDHQLAAELPHRAIVPCGVAPLTAKGMAVAQRRGIVVVADFLSLLGPLVSFRPAEGATGDSLRVDAAEVVSSIAGEVLGHDDGPYLGAAYRAEAFLATWQEQLPFGRPLA